MKWPAFNSLKSILYSRELECEEHLWRVSNPRRVGRWLSGGRENSPSGHGVSGQQERSLTGDETASRFVALKAALE